MSDDRSERLRRRRKRSQVRAHDEADGAETDELSERDGMSEPGDGGSVKDEQVGTYMYLPESQKKEIERLYNVLKAEYEYEFDEEFEKNRAFYPLLVQHGLEGLEGLDASAIRELLDEL